MLKMSRCKKHGICKHKTITVCELCATENCGTQPTAKQQPQPKMPSDSDWYDFACSMGIAPYEAKLAYKWFTCHFGRVR
jgi:hypothetical protein